VLLVNYISPSDGMCSVTGNGRAEYLNKITKLHEQDFM